MKKIFICVCIIGIISLFAGCEAENKVETNKSGQEALLEETKNASEGTNSNEGEDLTQAEYLTEAEELILKAFSFDTGEINPKIDTCNDLTSISYDITPSDFFMVEFQDGNVYPSTLYHFCHLGEDEGFNLAEETEDYFKEEMIEIAKDFLKNVYGVDCTDADIHAYGYANKIAVQVEIAPDEIFQVKFYYTDMTPVGVQFCSDIEAFERMMEVNQAKKYF